MIELLAVIVILAVIAMIAAPIVIGIIEESKERANRRSVDGLVRAGEIYLAESLQDPSKASNIEQERNLIQEIEYEGKRPEVGQIYVRSDGKVALAVKYGEKCYRKNYEGAIETLDYNLQSCKLNINIEKPTVSIETLANVFNENGWARENFYVTIKGIDYSGLGVTLKWCGTEQESCEPSTEIRNSVGQLQISQETVGMRICAKAIDGFLNESEVVCSNIYKLDKTAPTFTGLEEIGISEQNPGDFLEGVSASDSLSGISGAITYQPTTFDMSHAYMTAVEYRVEDVAGNVGTATRNVRVGTKAPGVTFTPTTGSINENGWARENFYVTVGAIDHSGTGIKEIHWCGTTSNSCEPGSSISENLNAYIQSEGNNNRVCAYAVDNFDQRGEVTCSDPYKLDKTLPEFTGIGDINIGKNSTVDLTNGVSVSDSLSGIDGTYSYNPTTVDTAKAGETTVTYRVMDLAGNVKEITRKVVVATEKPFVSYRLANASSVNSNGWAKSNFYVTINTTDYSGYGIDKIAWCGTTDNTCTPTSEVKAGSHNVLISVESSNNRICSYAVDKYGQQGSTTCSDAYKLDKTLPSISGLANITILAGSGINLSGGVTVNDNLSGIMGNFRYSPTSINTNTIQTVTVTYTVEDMAGNIGTATRTVTINPHIWKKYNTNSTMNYYWNQYSLIDTISYTVEEGFGRTFTPSSSASSTGPKYYFYSSYQLSGKYIQGSGTSSYMTIRDYVLNYYNQTAYPYMKIDNLTFAIVKNVHNSYTLSTNDLVAKENHAYSQGGYIGQVSSNTSSYYPNNGWMGDYWYVYDQAITRYSKGSTYYGEVTASNSQTYPTNGRHSDGYWYVKSN